MNSITHESEVKERNSPWMVSLAIWFCLGFASLFASFSINLGLNPTFERLVGIVSIAGGVLVIVTMARRKNFREAYKSTMPSPVKRAVVLSCVSLFLAAFNWGNLYILLFAIHSATAEPSVLTLTVSSKSTARPYREQWTSCKQYLRFREFAWYPGGTYCVERDVFNRIQRGATVSAFGQISLIGFTIGEIEFVAQALK